MKVALFLLLVMFLCACQHQLKYQTETVSEQTPGNVLAQSFNSEWRSLDIENTLYLTLVQGVVVIEMLPELAPLHVENTKALVRQGVFNDTFFYRVIDGFVAQGGPANEDQSNKLVLQEGAYTVSAEFTSKNDISSEYIFFDDRDGYADETGFIKSFAVGKDLQTGESWLLHCYGALAMGRADNINTGGTELYIVIGPAQRYLDRNTTVFGRVIKGMEHIQALKRLSGLDSNETGPESNLIQSIQVAADLPKNQMPDIEILDSNSNSFQQFLKSRKNRTDSWFVYQHNYMDACGIPIPIRLKP